MDDRHSRLGWRALTGRQKSSLGVLAAIQLVLGSAAWVDLARRAPAQVRGPKWRWALIIGVNFIGPLCYFWFGRLPDGSAASGLEHRAYRT